MTAETEHGNRLIYRPGQPDDGAGLLAVDRAAILRLGAQAYSPAETESWAAKLTAEGYASAMTEGGERFFIAADPNEGVVGFCSYKDAEVVGLYVHPDWARRGIARRLLRLAEAAIAAAGHGEIKIIATLVARSFYESQGYAVVDSHDWETRGGLVIAASVMRKTVA
ncbi:MAG: GNAT family N-acetyltransferase [Kiloniellales bacterium]|nr:GNAT family N-acetyltransferase [Kiloniellales bacterium]